MFRMVPSNVTPVIRTQDAFVVILYPGANLLEIWLLHSVLVTGSNIIILSAFIVIAQRIY